MTRQDELDLTAKVLSGDTDAFETLVLENQKNVYNLALRMTANEEDALDISQEVFLKAYQSLDSFRGDSRFSVWLYRMTYNMCIDHARKKQRRPVSALTIVDEEGEFTEQEIADLRYCPEDELEKKELRTAIGNAVASLSEDHRKVFLMRESSGMSYEQIAEMLSVSEGTVKSRLSRARKHLAKLLTADGTFSSSVRHTFRKEAP